MYREWRVVFFYSSPDGRESCEYVAIALGSLSVPRLAVMTYRVLGGRRKYNATTVSTYSFGACLERAVESGLIVALPPAEISMSRPQRLY